jgi:hypothetical protein
VPIGQKAMLYYVIIGAIRVTEMILMFWTTCVDKLRKYRLTYCITRVMII